MRNINSKFLNELSNKKLLIIAHRGGSAASIIENTSEAAKVARLQKADIIEADVIKSLDGKYYMFHDGNEKRLLGKRKNIKKMTSQEIEELTFYNEIGEKINKKVETLESYLNNIPKDILINIDRSWWYWDELLEYFDDYKDLHENILFKSPVKKEYLEKLNNHKTKYMYFPIVKSIEEIKLIEEYPNINLVGFEVIENSDDYKIINHQIMDKYKINKQFMLLGNTMNLDDKTHLFGSISDEKVLLEGFDKTWDKLIELGINAIQTDWIDILYRYRELKNS